MLRGSCPEALSGFVKFHPQYPVLKVPGGAFRPPCASRSRLARRCILRTSPPRVKGKFGFGRNNSGARAISAGRRAFPQLAQSLPRGPCRPRLWRRLHNRGGAGARDGGIGAAAKTAIFANGGPSFAAAHFSQFDGRAPSCATAGSGMLGAAARAARPRRPSGRVRACDRGARGKACGLDGRWSADEGKRRYPRAFPPPRRARGRPPAAEAGAHIAYARASFRFAIRSTPICTHDVNRGAAAA